MRLITFLGTGSYSETTYVWAGDSDGERTHTSRFASAAAAHMLDVDSLSILATPEARAMHGEAIELQFPDRLDVEWVPIPQGRDDQELWEIFGVLGDCVSEGEILAMDVTHGFRSLPMVAIMAAAFLRASCGAQVRHLLYGAWDARDQTVTPPRTPIFDLTPMFCLMEWAVAADRFVRQGDARDLAALLQESNPPYHIRRGDPALQDLSRRLGPLAAHLRKLSDALLLGRTDRALDEAQAVPDALDGMRDDYPQSARPFVNLVEQIRSSFEPLMPIGTGQVSVLYQQRELIRWYLEREYYVQAATLAREWVVSWVALAQGAEDVLDTAAREAAEEYLHDMQVLSKRGLSVQSELQGISHSLNLGQVWGTMCDLRNDLAHAAMRRSPRTPENLIETITRLLLELDKFQLPIADSKHST